MRKRRTRHPRSLRWIPGAIAIAAICLVGAANCRHHFDGGVGPC